MIIGLTGYAQSGKDTVANILVEKYGFERIAFADPIRDMLFEMNPNYNDTLLQQAVTSQGWDEVKKNSIVRRMLQNLGVGARKVLGEDVWIIAALRKIDDVNKHYVITDVRFENEAVIINQLNGKLWRVIRPGVEAVNNHISEHEMNGYKVDGELHNGGTLEELKLSIKLQMDLLLNAN
jgi:50S ribosomal subunit-associated GTPase HflX